MQSNTHSLTLTLHATDNTCVYAAVKGMYCTGWCKRGPSGIIGTNIPDAREAAAAVLQDIEVRLQPLLPRSTATC